MKSFRRFTLFALVALLLLAPVADVFAQTTAKGAQIHGRYITKGSGTAPTLTSCGTATVSGTDNAGIITHTVGAVSACTVTFNEAFDNAPVCVAQLVDVTTTDQNETSWVREISAAAADFTIHYEASASATNKYAYICIGR